MQQNVSLHTRDLHDFSCVRAHALEGSMLHAKPSNVTGHLTGLVCCTTGWQTSMIEQLAGLAGRKNNRQSDASTDILVLSPLFLCAQVLDRFQSLSQLLHLTIPQVRLCKARLSCCAVPIPCPQNFVRADWVRSWAAVWSPHNDPPVCCLPARRELPEQAPDLSWC